jgi:farnesyl diphosphate synthase/geranylgeranyl diphosphate synthase type II
MRYSLLNGGKRMRPALVYLAARFCRGSLDQADSAACAIEAIHSYSLVHDDLPAMDDDELRRGKPTCHIAFDEATAILAGDALLTWSFELLSQPDNIGTAQIQLQMVQALARAAGDLGMVDGQAFDLNSVGKQLTLDQLKAMHSAKTGALINVSLELGALSAEATDAEMAALRQYGTALGLAFQIKDDLLDIEGDTVTLGKPQGSDQARNKPTYPALVGAEQCRAWLIDLQQQAVTALEPFGSRSQALVALAQYVIERDH